MYGEDVQAVVQLEAVLDDIDGVETDQAGQRTQDHAAQGQNIPNQRFMRESNSPASFFRANSP